jgi:hypothetical protein
MLDATVGDDAGLRQCWGQNRDRARIFNEQSVCTAALRLASLKGQSQRGSNGGGFPGCRNDDVFLGRKPSPFAWLFAPLMRPN